MRNRYEIEKAIKSPNFNWLGRKPFIDDFIKHITSLERSSHICINGVWGSGKTTTILGIIDQLKKSETHDKTLILYLDAWKYEHYEEPLFALLKVMHQQLPDIFELIKSEFQKRNVEPQIGLNLPFFNITTSKNQRDSHNRLLNESEYIDTLNETMISAITKFKEERSNELIIFIDELDRAKPNFTLRTIELFHHLQDELPTHIVYSVDMNQLRSIIKHYYGYEYNVEIFTHKVFDDVIALKKLTTEQIESYIDGKITSFKRSYDVRSIRNLIFKYMKLDQLESLRTLNKICDSIMQKLQIGYFGGGNEAFGRSSYYLGKESYESLWSYVELLVVLEVFLLTEPMKVYEFLRGDNIKELLDFILKKNEDDFNEGLGNLILKSYCIDKEVEKKKRFSDLDENEKLIGLKRIFSPINEGHGSKPVFGSGEIF